MKKTINILDLRQNIMGAKLAYLVEPSKSYYSYTGNFSITNLTEMLEAIFFPAQNLVLLFLY